MLYEINSAVFITPKEIYRVKGDRVGEKPYLYEMNKLTALDVDWEEDFKIAEAVYDRFKNKKNILWDFDGVLMDSMPVRNKGFELVLKEFPNKQVQDLMQFHLKTEAFHVM